MILELVEVDIVVRGGDLGVGRGGEVLRQRRGRRVRAVLRVRRGQRALATVVDALVVVERVERAEHLVAQRAARRVQRLQVLLLRVPLQRQPRGQQLAAHLAPVPGSQRAHCPNT